MALHIIAFLLLSLFGLALSVFFFVRKKGDSYLNRLIAFYTLLFSFEMLVNCLSWSGYLKKNGFVHFTIAHAPAWLLYGPIVFLYVKRVVKKAKIKTSDFMLFIPAIIIFLLHLPFYVLNGQKKIDVVTNNQIYDYAIFPSYAIWIVIIIMFFFVGITYWKFKDLKNVGFIESIWLKWFVGSHLGFVFLFALYVFLVRFKIMPYHYDYLVDAGIAFFILILAYFGFYQSDVFNGNKSIKEIIPFHKYQKTGLSKALSMELKENLIRLMHEDKPYLKNNLRLNDIAELLHVSRNHASQIINEHFNLSFFDYINQYRVEEAKKLLLNYKKEDLNINQIAYSVGFNNRASFYKSFKKFTNTTPTLFANHLQVS